MRKVFTAVTALSAMLTVAITGPAQSAPFGNVSGMAAALDELDTVETIHCRPGWPHHYPTRWRRANGCGRGGGAVFITPGYSFRSYGFAGRRWGGGQHWRGQRWRR